jgi:hypothetical protein
MGPCHRFFIAYSLSIARGELWRVYAYQRAPHALRRKGYPLAAKVYQQDELSPPNKDALFADQKI